MEKTKDYLNYKFKKIAKINMNIEKSYLSAVK